MTLVVGVRADEAIVLVADSRASRMVLEQPIIESDSAQKLFPIGLNQKYGLGISGVETVLHGILERLPKESAGGDFRAFVQEIGRHLEGEFSDHFHGRAPLHWPKASLMLVGYDDTGMDSIYCLESQAGFFGGHTRKICARVGSEYPVPLIDAVLKNIPPNSCLTVQQAQRVGIWIVREMADVDPTVGGKLHMAVVTPAGYQDRTHEVATFEKHVSKARRRTWRTAWNSIR